MVDTIGENKMSMITAGPLAAIMLAVTVISATAQNWPICTGNPGVDWDQQIKSCTALIQSVTEPKENIAVAFFNRALAYEEKGEYGRAIADYSDAIRLNPNDAEAYFYRGLDKQRLGDKAGAEADIAAAKRLNPNIDK